jgi:hypothetical protein
MTHSTHSPANRAPARITAAAALGALFLAGPLAASAHAAATVPPLATASAFSVLAGTTVTNTGATTIDRSVGVHPGSAVTGRNTMTIGGTVHKADAVALQAKKDLTTAFNQAAGQTDNPPNTVDNELGGETLTGGVYTHPSAMGLTGALTLDGENNPDSVWVFQAGSTLITAPGASVVLENQANPCNVFWQVGSSATLDTTTSFVGTIMAEASITMNTGATIQGRTLARSGAVNLHNNVFTSPDCDYDEDVADADETDTAGPVDTGDTTPATTGKTSGNTTKSGNTPRGANTPAGSTTPPAESQVATTPTGSVDTGYAGSATGATNELAPVGWMLAAGFGGLALVALRRRRVM